MSKKISIIIIICLILFGGISAFLASKLQFNYDFETFFPQGDEDLEYFLNYRKTFENDNDYVLISLGNNQSVFNQAFLKKVDQFSDELSQFNHVNEVISPTKIKTPVVNTFGFIELPLIHIDNPAQYKNDSIRILKANEYNKTLFSDDFKSICIVIKNSQIITKIASDELLADIESLIDKYNFEEVHYAGKIRAQKTYLNKMQVDLILFLSISVLLIIIFLILSFRSFFGVFVPMVTVLFAIVGVLGIMQLMGKQVDIMATLLPTILFVVGMSDAVHIYNRYIEELRGNKSKIDALKITFKEVGLATFFTSLTTAVGFATLMMVTIKPIQEFGMYTAIGVLLAFLIAILFLPACLTLLEKPKLVDKQHNKIFWNRSLAKIFLYVIRHPKKILFSYSFLIVLATIGLFQLKIDYKLLEDLAESNPLQQDFRFFENRYSGIRPFEMGIHIKDKHTVYDYPVMKELDKVEHYLYNEYEAGFIYSPVGFIKSINKAVHSGNSSFYKIPETEKSYNNLFKKIKKTTLLSKAKSLTNKKKTIARFTGKMDDMGSAEVKLHNEKFYDFFQSKIDKSLISYKITGTATLVDKNNESLAKNMVTGLMIAFLLIAMLIGFIFKSLRMAILSLIPNIIPLALIGGLMGVLGTTINMSTCIIFTIAFGIAVDDTIHFMSKFNIEQRKGLSTLYALKRTYLSTGKAIILTTLILCGGFISLIFSDFKSTFLIGSYVGLILFLAVITDLLVLPVLLMRTKSKK